MAFGSQRSFAYTDDAGTVYAIRADESNVELVNGSNSAFAPAGSTRPPADLKIRYVVLRGANTSTKKVPVLSPTIYNGISVSQVFSAPAVGEENPSGTEFRVVQKVPERILRRPVSIDTGKNDGD
jgi:hypothetical protein